MKNIFIFLFCFSFFSINAQISKHHTYTVDRIKDDFEEVVQTIEEIILKANIYDSFGSNNVEERFKELFIKVKIFKDLSITSLNTIYFTAEYKQGDDLRKFDLERDYTSVLGLKVAGENALVYDEPPSPYESFKTSADGKKVKVIDNTISIQGPGHPMGVSSYEEIFFNKIMNSKSDMKVYIRTSSYRINFTLPGFNY
jgi:hypothetical protein